MGHQATGQSRGFAFMDVRTAVEVRKAQGRIAKLLVGQSYGFIRLTNDREIFFHRSDVRDGTCFNDFVVGDTVTFELLDDKISGARALRVERRRSVR